MQKKMIFAILGFFVMSLYGLPLTAQSIKDENKLFVAQFVRYLDLDKQVTEKEQQEWAELITKGENQSLPASERTDAWKKFHTAVYTALEINDPNLKNVLNSGAYANGAVTLNIDLKPYSTKTTTANTFSFQKKGTGKQAVLLLTELGFDTRIYDQFAEFNKDIYTMYIIPFPGESSLGAYKRPDKRTAETIWLNNFVSSLASFITQKKLNDVVVITSGKSIIPAIQLAKLQPQKIKSLVAINGIIRVSPFLYPSPQFAKGTADWKEFYPRSMPFAELFHALPPFNYSGAFENAHAADRKRILSLINDLHTKIDNYAYYYLNNELSLVDARNEMKDLSIPLLSLIPLPDELHPTVVSSRSRAIQWQKLKAQYPLQPIFLEYIEGVRDIPVFDKPGEISLRITAFLKDPAGYKTHTPPSTHVVNASPRAFVSRTIRNTDITVSYGSPAVKGRKIFGQVVPYKQVWRAGANESTEITASRDVMIQGQLLPKGSYSLFIRPDSASWTVIFNKIIHQWGAFSYDKTFNALELNVTPTDINQQEWLSYGFENVTEYSADLVMSWENKKVAIPIEEGFIPPFASAQLKNANWQLLLEDVQNDGNVKSYPDGKQLYYYYDKRSDSLWFKFITYGNLNMTAPGLTISMDTDADQKTGTNWYGSNRTFTVDLMIACGPVRQGDGYNGYNGLTNAAGIATGNWNNVQEENVKFYFSPDDKAYFIGLSKKDLKLTSSRIDLIGSVGANSSWNDDIGADGKFASITFE